jgi:hypothetical protein
MAHEAEADPWRLGALIRSWDALLGRRATISPTILPHCAQTRRE